MCSAALSEGSELICTGCDRRYAVRDAVPILLSRDLSEQKLAQSAFFDSDVDPEWEIQRPSGAPPLYQRLLEERYARAIRGLEPLLHGATALVVCGGSGIDAQFLAQAGARVTTSDLSHGAARRALERARRFGFEITSIVADAERLPFRDRSFDLVYVHDGLHHLERPREALDEMTRVAARAVAVTEPARAVATRLAVRLGIAFDREEAGNRVERLELDEVARLLGARGFRPLHPHRYWMFYRHEPGPLSRALSRPSSVRSAFGALRLANAVAGRFGNKLAIQAVRAE